MPLYEYQCRNCGQNLEIRQKFSDDPLSECPNCGAPQGLYRVVQAAGVVFKGSGFYITDSRGGRENLTTTPKKKEEGKATEGTSTSTESTSTPTAAPSSDSKPAAAPAAS